MEMASPSVHHPYKRLSAYGAKGTLPRTGKTGRPPDLLPVQSSLFSYPSAKFLQYRPRSTGVHMSQRWTIAEPTITGRQMGLHFGRMRA